MDIFDIYSIIMIIMMVFVGELFILFNISLIGQYIKITDTEENENEQEEEEQEVNNDKFKR